MFYANSILLVFVLGSCLLMALVYIVWYMRKTKALIGKEDELSTLFEQQPEAWVIFDGISLQAVKANQKAMNLFGIYRAGFLSKLNFKNIFSEDLGDDEVQLLMHAVDNNAFSHKLLDCRSLQGRSFRINVSIHRVYEGNLFCRFAEHMEQAIPVLPDSSTPSAAESEITEHPDQHTATRGPIHEEQEEPVLHDAQPKMPAQEVEATHAGSAGVIRTSADAVAILDNNQQFIEVNESFASLTGYQVDELRKIGFDQLVHPTDGLYHESWIRQLTEGKYRVARTERKILRKDGRTSNLELLGAGLPNRSAVFITAIDTNESRIKHQSLLRDSENLQALVENTVEAVMSVNALGQISIINQQFCRLFEMRGMALPEEGHLYEEYLDARQRREWKDRFRRVLVGKTENYREEYKDAEGNVLVYEVLLYPVKDENGLITGVSLSGRDITDRIQQEADLRDAKEKAESAARAKSEFLAVMSHEIRTPLNGLLGISELLNSTNLDKQQKEFVDIIRLSGEALLQVISDILDFSKIEANRLQLEYSPFQLTDAVKETFNLLSGKALEKGLQFSTDIGTDVPAFILGDKARLRQILMNLVSNAVKFTEHGGVMVGVKMVREHQGEIELEFSVSDTGIGIELENASKLFTAFTQADPSTYRKYGGSGLGLTICKMLVDLMGGKIWVESKVGEGSTFYFTVVTRRSDEASVKPAQVKKAAYVSTAADTAGKLSDRHPVSILLAEDNDINRLLAGKLFERLGYRIDAVTNGKEAFDYVQSRKYDIVFMDVQMPEWDGLEATRHIRSQLPADRQPVIIAMTAFAGADDRELCKNAGMDDYVSKPVILDDLERLIIKWEGVTEQRSADFPLQGSKSSVVPGPVPLINQEAIQRLMDIGRQTDPGFLQQVLDMFMNQAPLSMEEIRQHFEKGDFTGMWKAAHKLKGTCLNIGAARLAEVCKEIERKGRNLEIGGLLGLTMQLENDYKSTLKELRSLFQYN